MGELFQGAHFVPRRRIRVSALLALALVAGLQTPPSTHYRIRVPADLSALEVTTTLPRGASRLLMDSVQAQHLPRGWASLVRDLAAHQRGRPVAVAPLEGAAWALPPGIQGPITLTYRVDLGFTRVPWPAGNEQAGAAFDEMLYLVGRALFITSNRSTASTIEFALPEGWRVSTSWRSAGGDPRRFLAGSVTELIRNALVVGRHASVGLSAGPFELELALPGHSPAVAGLVQPVLSRVLAAYMDLFPDTPPTKYLMSFLPAASDDGEAFVSSASFTAAEPVTADGVIVWGNFLAHELMHFWNGQRIRGAGPRSSWRWMAEGFTEYYANVMLARQGLIAPEMFLKKAERHIGNYLYFATAPALPRLSLAEAGANTSANRFGVYDGGWTAAFCLDGLVREASGDRRSLDDMMRALWLRVGPADSGYTVAALDSLSNRLAGSDLGGVVSRYVETSEVLPVAACLRRVGLAAATKGYAAEAFLFPARDASSAAIARGMAMYGPVAR